MQATCKQTLLFIAIHYCGCLSFEVKGQCRLLLPPCLIIMVVQQPGTSSPPSQLKLVLLWGCHLNVEGLIHQHLLFPATDLKSLVAGPLWWGGRGERAILTDLWAPMMCILRRAWLYKAMFVRTSSLSPWWQLEHSVETLASEFKLVTDNLLHLCRSQLRSHWKKIHCCTTCKLTS